MQLKGLLTEQPCICPEKIVHMYDLALAGPEAGETLVAFSSRGLFWMSRKGTFPRISALLAPLWVRTSGAGSLCTALWARQDISWNTAMLCSICMNLGRSEVYRAPLSYQPWQKQPKAWCGTRKIIAHLLPTKISDFWSVFSHIYLQIWGKLSIVEGRI